MTVVADDLEDLWQRQSFDEELDQLLKQIADRVFCTWMSAHTPPRRFPSVPHERIIEATPLGNGRWFVRLAGSIGLYASSTQECYFGLVPRHVACDRLETDAAELESMEDIRRLLKYAARRDIDVFYASLDRAKADLQESLVTP